MCVSEKRRGREREGGDRERVRAKDGESVLERESKKGECEKEDERGEKWRVGETERKETRREEKEW